LANLFGCSSRGHAAMLLSLTHKIRRVAAVFMIYKMLSLLYLLPSNGHLSTSQNKHWTIVNIASLLYIIRVQSFRCSLKKAYKHSTVGTSTCNTLPHAPTEHNLSEHFAKPLGHLEHGGPSEKRTEPRMFPPYLPGTLVPYWQTSS